MLSFTRTNLRLATIAGALSVLSLAQPARSQDAPGDCACLGPSPGGVAGSVTSVRGDVSTLGSDGFTRVKVGGRVRVGSRVVVGADGVAGLVFSGGCKVSLGGDTDAEIVPVDKRACVRVTKPETSAAATDPIQTGGVETPVATAGLGPLSGTGLVIGGLSLGVGAIATVGAVTQNSNQKGAMSP